MKKLKDALTGIEFRRLVESHAPIYLRDFATGTLARYAPDDSIVVQVDGEADTCRTCGIGKAGDETTIVNAWSPPITGTFRPGQGFSWH